jgi:hypothetical protein
VINKFTDAFPEPAGGSLFQLNSSGAPRWVGAVKPPA